MMILVTPNWPIQPWFNQILELCIANPLPPPLSHDLSTNPQDQIHPLVENRTLRLWKVSGAVYLQSSYQLGLHSLSSKPEREALHLIKNHPGENEFAGVLDFLAFLLEKNYEYSSINVHRSPLSAYH